MLGSWGILTLAASSFCCDLTSFLVSKLAASQKNYFSQQEIIVFGFFWEAKI